MHESFITLLLFMYNFETVFFCFRPLKSLFLTRDMELFVTLVNGLQTLTNVTKNSILDVAGLLDTPLNEALSVGGSLSARR